MANGKKLIKILNFLIGITFYNCISLAMAEKPYHHLPDGTFRNPEGSPVRSKDVKFSYRTFTKEKKKIDITVPKDHVIDKIIVKENLEKFKYDDYIAWIGHATFLIKLGETTIITDPVFSNNAGPLIFGPKWKPGFTKAIHYWVPSIATSAITIYKGKEFSEWNGHALITSLKDQSLRKLIFNDLSNIKEDIIFKNKIGRIRDIQIHPINGKIYFLGGDSFWLMQKN